MDYALEVRNIFFQAEDRVIFRELDFALPRGESFLVLGGGGSGKSLLLKICAGLVAPSQGEVKVNGVNVALASREELQDVRSKMGFVFQNSALISNMAVYDNIALPLRYHRKWSEADIRRRVDEVMTLFEVDRAFDRSIPAHLSLEMHRRAALARALVLQPEILLLDQPTSGFGPEEAQSILEAIRAYQQGAGASILEVAGKWSSLAHPVDRVGILEGGRISAQGTREEMASYMEKSKREGLKESGARPSSPGAGGGEKRS